MEREISLARLQMAVRRCISSTELYLAKAKTVKEIRGLTEEDFQDIINRLTQIESELNG